MINIGYMWLIQTVKLPLKMGGKCCEHPSWTIIIEIEDWEVVWLVYLQVGGKKEHEQA